MNEQPVLRDLVHPVGGTRGFRRNCSLALRDRNLVVTDRRRNVFRFPLDGSPGTPAAFDYMVGGPEWVIVDQSGRALVVGSKGAWDWQEMDELCEGAGMKAGWRPGPLPPLREDGVRLDPSPWLRRVTTMPAIALAGVVLARLDIVPAIPVLIFGALTILTGAVMWAIGFFAPVRRGPGVIAGEKRMAELQAKEEAKNAKGEAKKKRRQQRGKQ